MKLKEHVWKWIAMEKNRKICQKNREVKRTQLTDNIKDLKTRQWNCSKVSIYIFLLPSLTLAVTGFEKIGSVELVRMYVLNFWGCAMSLTCQLLRVLRLSLTFNWIYITTIWVVDVAFLEKCSINNRWGWAIAHQGLTQGAYYTVDYPSA